MDISGNVVAILRPSLEDVGASLVYLRVVGHLGVIFGFPGVYLGPPWGYLGSCWVYVGLS